LLSKGTGFLVYIFLAAWFGVNNEMDAYYFVIGVPLFLVGIITITINSIFVPVFAEIRTKSSDKVEGFLGGTFILLCFILMGLTIILYFIGPYLIKLFVSFDKATYLLSIKLLYMLLPLIVLRGLVGLLKAAFDTYQFFNIPVSIEMIKFAFTIFLIYFFKSSLGIFSIIVGILVAEGINIFLHYFTLAKKGIGIKFSFKLERKIIELFKLGLPMTIGVIALSLNIIIDKTMASYLGEGSISILEYAYKIRMIPESLALSGILIVTLSYWSKAYAEERYNELRDSIRKLCLYLILMFSPLVIGGIIFRQQIVKILFARGNFTPANVEATSSMLGFYLIGVIPFLVGNIFYRIHLVLKNTQLLMRLGILNCILNASFNFIFMKLIGLNGIALSTSVTFAIISILQYIEFRKKIKHIEVTQFLRAELKTESNIKI